VLGAEPKLSAAAERIRMKPSTFKRAIEGGHDATPSGLPAWNILRPATHASSILEIIMAQVKVYGNKQFLDTNRSALSDIIHSSMVTALGLPPGKKFHRFIPLETGDFIFPEDRTPSYTIVEISMFEGRSEERIKGLIKAIMKEVQERLKLHPNDLEITVSQSPRYCWGIRGKTGDELELNYKIDA
jgi:phenylpyruvate tautomerase PptA (4-oxalocrotonate tautomerase family)